MRQRCRRCFRPVDPGAEAVHVCPAAPTPKKAKEPCPAGRYERPSRPRQPRAEYLAEVAAGHGTRKCASKGCQRPECREAANAYMREWKRRRKAKA